MGEWFVEPDRNRLRTETETVQVEPKIMEILVCLIEHDGDTVTKKQFLHRVWNDTVVTEDVLTRGISELRKVLGDNPNDPEYVETIRKTGYRLLAPVTHTDPPPTSVDESAPSSPEPSYWAQLPRDIDEVRGTVRSYLRHCFKRELCLLLHSPNRLWRVWGPIVLVLLLSAGGLMWFLWPSGTSSPPTAVPFTSFPGKEHDPALAPDGHQLAFAWTGSENRSAPDIYVKQNDVGRPLQLTHTPAREYSPAWSPDAQRIAFVRAADDRYSLHLTPLIGGNEREVLHLEKRRIHSVVWGPDQQTLLFSAQDTPYGTYRLYRFSLNTMTHQALTDPPDSYRGDVTPSLHHQRGTVAFVRSVTKHVEDLYTVPLQGGTPTRLTRKRTQITGLDWRATEHAVVYATPTQMPRLWQVDAGGGNKTPLPMTGLGDQLHQPSIAHTGRMALTQRSPNINIWGLRRQKNYDRFTKQPLIESTRWDSAPSISPSGQRIAFSSRRSGQFQLWTASRDGTTTTRLTALDASLVHTPQWGPKGHRIAFTARRDGQNDIYVTRSTGTSTRRLTRDPAADRAPSWSPQGDTLYFASNRSGRWQIWATPTDSTHRTQSPRQVTTHGGFAARPAPDRHSLFVVRRDTAGIWRVPLDGGPGTHVVGSLAPYDWGNWAVTQYGIYFVRRDENRPLLAYYSFKSERLFRLAFLDDLPRTPSLAVAPGGEWFLYARDQSQSDILLVDRARSD